MRDFKVVMPSRRCYVVIKSEKKQDKETIYIEAGPSWKRKSKTTFPYLIHAISHESVHLVIERLVPRLKIKTGSDKGLWASAALDNIPDHLTTGIKFDPPVRW